MKPTSRTVAARLIKGVRRALREGDCETALRAFRRLERSSRFIHVSTPAWTRLSTAVDACRWRAR